MRYENPERPPEPVPGPERPPMEVIVSRRNRPDQPAPDSTETDQVRVFENPTSPPDYAYQARMERLRRERAASRLNTIGKAIEAVWMIVGVLEALLAMRFIFEIAGAHRTAGFIEFLYGVTSPFVAGFDGIFPIGRFGANIFDPNILVAMLVWALIGALIARLLTFAIEPQNRI